MISKYYLQVWIFVILLSFIPISNIVVAPTFGFILFILASTVLFYMTEKILNFNSKMDVRFRYIKGQKFELILLTSFIVLFFLNAVAAHLRLPILSLFGMDALRYNKYGIGGVQGLTNAIWLALTTLIYFNKVYFNKYKKIVFIILLLYPILLISRQLIISLAIQLIFIWLTYTKILRFKKFLYLFACFLLGIVIFGVLGDIRVSADGVTTASALLKSIIKPTALGLLLPLPLLWFYTYAVTPLSNLLLNLSYSQTSGNLSEYFSAILPSPLRHAIFGEHGFQGYSNILLVNPNLNMSTAYIAPYLSAGWLGIYIHTLILASFLFFTKLLYAKNIYFHMTYFVAIQVFILSIFSNVLFYLPIIFQFVIFLCLGIMFELAKKSKNAGLA